MDYRTARVDTCEKFGITGNLSMFFPDFHPETPFPRRSLRDLQMKSSPQQVSCKSLGKSPRIISQFVLPGVEFAPKARTPLDRPLDIFSEHYSRHPAIPNWNSRTAKSGIVSGGPGRSNIAETCSPDKYSLRWRVHAVTGGLRPVWSSGASPPRWGRQDTGKWHRSLRRRPRHSPVRPCNSCRIACR